LSREQGKQTTLENSKHFRRSQRSPYQGNSDILVGVSFTLTAPAVVAVVQGSTGKTLAFRSTRQLLDKNYELLNRQQQKQKKHDQQRRKNQQKGRFEQLSESELGLYIDRLLAKAIISLAKQYQAGSIVLPDLKGLREKIQSELEAKAERKIPGNREAQSLYAKEYRKQVHRHSYHRLAENIQSQAAKVGIQVEVGHQPFQGSSQEKARDLAIMTYHAR
jgi:IS605 OrfB family transposase